MKVEVPDIHVFDGTIQVSLPEVCHGFHFDQGRGKVGNAIEIHPAVEYVSRHHDLFYVVGEGGYTGIFHGVFSHAYV